MRSAAYDGSGEFGETDVVGRFDFSADTRVQQVLGAPDDADWDRWSLAGSPQNDFLFLYRKGSGDRLYSFISNSGRDFSRFTDIAGGVVRLSQPPGDLDTSDFSVAFDPGRNQLAYFGFARGGDRSGLYVGAYNLPASGGTALFEFGSGKLPVRNIPGDADWDHWGTAWSQGGLILQVAREGSTRNLHIAVFDSETQTFDFASEASTTATIQNRPFGVDPRQWAVAAGGSNGALRLYFQDQRIDDVLSGVVGLDVEGWYWNDWLDAYFAGNFPWIWLGQDRGWFWVAEGGDDDAVYLYSDSSSSQWLWTTPELFPMVVDLSTGIWEEL